MTNLLDQIDFSDLDNNVHSMVLGGYAAQVPGRVAHIDADFIAYQVACETRDELDGLKPRRTLAQMKEQVRSIADYQTKLVGAESYVLYITPPASTKGGRSDTAVAKEYQGNRKGRVKPEHLDTIRAYMGESLPSNISLNQEADDALCQAMYKAMEEGNPDLHVLCSKDKDLNMAPGYYWDYNEQLVLNCEDTFGWIGLDRSKKSPKVVGRGTKFFWAQLLMGDAADNILGLPSYHENGRDHKCGPVTAYNFLKDAKSNIECYDIVRDLYKGSKHEWINWRTGSKTTCYHSLYGDANSLWLLRYPGDSVDAFLRETLEEKEK